MANKEINDLASATKLTGTETIHVVQAGNSRKAPIQVLNSLGATVKEVTTDTYTLLASDAGKFILFNSAVPVTVTVNDGVFTLGDEVLCEQRSTGIVTFVGGAGFTLYSFDSIFSTAGEHAVAGLKFTGATAATMFGNLA